MRTIGAYEVKTHLSRILNELEEEGEIIAITRHGRTIALLTPVPEQDPIVIAIENIRRNRKGIKLGKNVSLKSLINEGRK